MLPKASVKSPVMYIALVNAQDQPIYMKNFSDKKHDELQIQLLIYSSLDLIQAQSKSIEVLTQIHTYVQVDRKLAANKDSSSFVGHVTSAFLSEVDVDVYGYLAATKLKIVVILQQKPDRQNYDENLVKAMMKSVYDLYMQDQFNPFHDNKNKLSQMLLDKLEHIIGSYQQTLSNQEEMYRNPFVHDCSK
eukprot:TRINITY_DN6209_c0_g1_i10.p1 TRINITY_DN6209_c0_g1~~TRINITY_DN6209_c0_g1_i10.p1  ORF type:complete len:190 (-),score=48.53 TRINITY_DN6209_c0_g1_i10:120-689(-)